MGLNRPGLTDVRLRPPREPGWSWCHGRDLRTPHHLRFDQYVLARTRAWRPDPPFRPRLGEGCSRGCRRSSACARRRADLQTSLDGLDDEETGEGPLSTACKLTVVGGRRVPRMRHDGTRTADAPGVSARDLVSWEAHQRSAEDLRRWDDANSHGARFSARRGRRDAGSAGECSRPECRRGGAAPLAARQVVPDSAPFPGMLAGGLFGTARRMHRAEPADFPVAVPLTERPDLPKCGCSRS